MSVPDRIGNYPIERELGRGGMGIVYLGRDTRLDRLVAIKVLPDAFAHDAERLARFEREARMLASLTHPNVAGIYGVEESAGHRFLVLEYVEGETLAERLARGPLPVDETIEAGRQIAAALEAAHESGIVHRDLKPGNVKLTPAGEIKVLDFGLARGGGAAPASDPGLSASPTVAATAMTSAGVILGTAAYMSPEQARGRAVDRRTDIWSFGCVLYECLTGRQAFGGETVSDMIALILQGEPDWKALPANVPPHLRALMERCLTKDPKKRLRDIGEARLLLEGGAASLVSGAGVSAAGASPRGVSTRLPWTVAAAATIVALTFGGLWLWTPRPAGPAHRVSLEIPTTSYAAREPVNVALSEDGSQLAVSAVDSVGSAQIWMRALDDLQGRMIPATDDGVLPFWSPDGRYLAFSTQDKLKKVDLRGGRPEVLCDIASYGRGGSWSPRGVIVFSGGAEGPIFKVSEDGGAPEPATTLDSAETGHRFPRFLPDGRHFLFAAMPPRQSQFEIYVGSIDSPSRRRLMTADGTPVYVDPGYLIYTRNGRVVAHRFDAGRQRLEGAPVVLRDEPDRTDFLGAPSITAGRRGGLGYFAARTPRTRLAWADLRGGSTDLPMSPSNFETVWLSPDGRRAAVVRATSPTSSDLWLLTMDRYVLTRLTYSPGRVDRVVWSPDGKRVAFANDRNGRWDLFEKVVDDAAPEKPILVSGSLIKYPSDYTSDGATLIFEQLGERTGWDVFQMRLEGDRTPQPLVVTSYDEQNARVSPDGRWLAFASNESGRTEIHVQGYAAPGRRQQVSSQGGVFPIWRADGGRLMFIAVAGPTSVEVTESGNEIRFGPARQAAIRPGTIHGSLMPDLQRALLILPADSGPVRDDLTLVLNWRTELKQH
jgi:Tol biopolymer transport system component/predicted Ser/Thr protein kinase